MSLKIDSDPSLEKFTELYRRKSKTRRVSLILSDSDFKELSRLANKHGLPASKYIRAVYKAYHDGHRILPKDVQDDLQILKQNIVGACSNINRLTHTCHIDNLRRKSLHSDSAPTFNVEAFKASIIDLEAKLFEFLKRHQ